MSGRIAILGATGDLGFGLALRFAKAGMSVIIGSRDEAKAKAAVAKLKEILGSAVDVDGMLNADAVANSSITILSVPFSAQLDILNSVLKSLKEGDIFVDATVPLEVDPQKRVGRTIPVSQGSAAQRAAELLPKGVHMVSAFKNIGARAVQEVERELDCDVIVCGDDEDSKRVVMELVEKIPGARAVDGGSLESSKVAEEITGLLVTLNMRYGVHSAGIRITGLGKKLRRAG